MKIEISLIQAIGIAGAYLVLTLNYFWGCDKNIVLAVMWAICCVAQILMIIAAVFLQTR